MIVVLKPLLQTHAASSAKKKKKVQVWSKRVSPKLRTQKGTAIADYMRTLGHCQETGENLEILEGGRKTSREQANSRLDENHSCFVGSLQKTEFLFVLLLTLTLPMFGRLVGSFRASDRDVLVGLGVASFVEAALSPVGRTSRRRWRDPFSKQNLGRCCRLLATLPRSPHSATVTSRLSLRITADSGKVAAIRRRPATKVRCAAIKLIFKQLLGRQAAVSRLA